jgi:hypothetical protein
MTTPCLRCLLDLSTNSRPWWPRCGYQWLTLEALVRLTLESVQPGQALSCQLTLKSLWPGADPWVPTSGWPLSPRPTLKLLVAWSRPLSTNRTSPNRPQNDPSPSVPSSCQLPQAFSLKSQNTFSDALVCQHKPTLEHLWPLSFHSHLQGFLAYHNTLPNQATPPRSPIIPQGPLPPCPLSPPCPCPCPHGSHNPSALPINPLISTIYPHSILP